MDARQNTGGILILGVSAYDLVIIERSFAGYAGSVGLSAYVDVSREASGHGVRFRLREGWSDRWLPDWDTLGIGARLDLDPIEHETWLELEIVLAMLSGPVVFSFPGYEEFAASIRIRKNIVSAAQRTALAFHTDKIARPVAYWAYSEEHGYTLLPEQPLIEALQQATQPEISGQRYPFSCYRATEYVILLGIAQELSANNPALLMRLERQWESAAIQSRRFSDTFLREYGSMLQPLPATYYVPGDRLWLRNPDQRSSDIVGYEGAWMLYLGAGLFSNFWNPDQPHTLAAKCAEIYHWRYATYTDAQGKLNMDEAVVDEMTRNALEDQAELGHIMRVMLRLRDARGGYQDGGCLDASREYPRCVCPGTSDIALEEHISISTGRASLSNADSLAL